MSELQPFGRALLLLGLILCGLGVILLWGSKIPWLGRLPGDIAVRRDHFAFYFPLTSSIVVSVIISLILWMVSRFRQ